jgi:hypothetical protein
MISTAGAGRGSAGVVAAAITGTVAVAVGTSAAAAAALSSLLFLLGTAAFLMLLRFRLLSFLFLLPITMLSTLLLFLTALSILGISFFLLLLFFQFLFEILMIDSMSQPRFPFRIQLPPVLRHLGFCIAASQLLQSARMLLTELFEGQLLLAAGEQLCQLSSFVGGTVLHRCFSRQRAHIQMTPR